METLFPPRLVIAAPQGRSGKTTVTAGLCAALAARGLTVQPFKKGPDYIDPSWLTAAAGRPCRNLDPFLMGQETVGAVFGRGCRGADLAVIEGAMGLYDGLDLDGSGSTAALARWLDAPILLVVNAQRITRSVAALVQGYQHFEPGTRIAGVILNNVARGRQQAIMTEAIERYCGIPVVGVLPRSESLAIPDRHLGLIPRAENESLVPALVAARDAALAHFDLDRILAIAGFSAELIPRPPLPSSGENAPLPPQSWGESDSPRGRGGGGARAPVRVGVMQDRVFTFYYPENLEALQDAGAGLVFIDSLNDAHLPAINALYIGGGFPEVFMAELEANTSLRADVAAAIEGGLPTYAECGGLMYLSRRITWGDRSAAMVGALPCEVEMTAQPQGHGYVEAEVDGPNPFFATGAVLRGHEFHNSRPTGLEAAPPTAYRLRRGNGLGGGRDGLVYRNVLASYMHLHAAGAPGWAEGLVRRAEGRVR